MVPGARIELARCRQRGILNPVRLPVPPSRHLLNQAFRKFFKKNERYTLITHFLLILFYKQIWKTDNYGTTKRQVYIYARWVSFALKKQKEIVSDRLKQEKRRQNIQKAQTALSKAYKMPTKKNK